MDGRSGGLVDLQVNGFAGVDFNDAGITSDAVDHALNVMLQTGVTTCLPTFITAEADVLHGRLHALDRAVCGSMLGPLMVPGYHLEGPFLNPGAGFAGCHPPAAMVSPDPALVERWCAGLRRPVLMLTLAPELPGADALIRWAVARGRVVAIGHADAGTEVVARAVAAGATLSTHLGNGLPGMLPKLDNPLWAQLGEDGLVAGFIADGIHVPIPALRAMLRAKGPDRALLVTDAVSAAAAPPGHYAFAGMAIERATDGSVRLPDGRLAGSALTLDQAVRNVAAWGIVDWRAAVAMASGTPRIILAPALHYHNLPSPWHALRWQDGHVMEAEVGNKRAAAPAPSGRRSSRP